MNYNKSNKYSKEFIQKNIMGPNPIKLLEELMEKHPLPKGSTVMDLGCGRGVTSVFLAKEYGLHVFATDLWVSPTENKQRFDQMSLTKNEIIPIKGEAHDLPYAEEFSMQSSVLILITTLVWINTTWASICYLW